VEFQAQLLPKEAVFSFAGQAVNSYCKRKNILLVLCRFRRGKFFRTPTMQGGQYEVEIRFHHRFDGYPVNMGIRRFLSECDQHVRVGGKSRPGFGKLVGGLY
jgi:hypothetical protein